MKDKARFIVAGAALGTILGAIVGLLYARSQTRKDGSGKAPDARQLILLGGGILNLIRQIAEMV